MPRFTTIRLQDGFINTVQSSSIIKSESKHEQYLIVNATRGIRYRAQVPSPLNTLYLIAPQVKNKWCRPSQEELNHKIGSFPHDFKYHLVRYPYYGDNAIICSHAIIVYSLPVLDLKTGRSRANQTKWVLVGWPGHRDVIFGTQKFALTSFNLFNTLLVITDYVEFFQNILYNWQKNYFKHTDIATPGKLWWNYAQVFTILHSYYCLKKQRWSRFVYYEHLFFYL